MVRQCAIPECKNNDQVTLCHRFPKRKDFMEKWRNSLALDAVDADELFSRYVVCTQHFQATDYRNSASRMLNLMAVPTLNVFWKGEFYDPPTTAQIGAKQGVKDRQAKISPANNKTEPDPEETEIEVLEVEQAELEERITVETIEPVDDEFEVFYIEEEAKNTEELSSSESMHIEALEECQLEIPLPPAKRKCVQENPRSEANNPSKISVQDSAAQTDENVESAEEQRLVVERYPEYVSYSRLELAKELKETTEQLAEVKKKLAHIEAAHAVVREAFKSIIS